MGATRGDTMWNRMNYREQLRHRIAMRSLSQEEQLTKEKTRQAIEKIRRELTNLHAYRHVYRKFSLSERDIKPTPNKHGESVRPSVDATQADARGSDHRRPEHSTSEAMRHNCLPPLSLATPRHVDQLQDLKIKTNSNRQRSQSQQPSQNVKGRTLKPIQPCQTWPRRRSTKRSKCPSEASEPRWPSDVLPAACRSTFSLRRFLAAEAVDAATRLCAEARRRRRSDRLLRQVRLPPLVDRSRSTSAIFRDFRRYQAGSRRRSRGVDTNATGGDTWND